MWGKIPNYSYMTFTRLGTMCRIKYLTIQLEICKGMRPKRIKYIEYLINDLH
jgi:hypothetical protein